ncbi:hypothetical protein, partial [Pseudescherichia sp.]|uniref:hypothetical protein n=1 Tax=Pseudescherichia sp. TaxID=2055881 RepID=UPI00289F404F
RPCQGRGREFESRFPLQIFSSELIIHSANACWHRFISVLSYSCKQSYPQGYRHLPLRLNVNNVNNIFLND